MSAFLQAYALVLSSLASLVTLIGFATGETAKDRSGSFVAMLMWIPILAFSINSIWRIV